MVCNKCGKDLGDKDRAFCPFCGNSLKSAQSKVTEKNNKESKIHVEKKVKKKALSKLIILPVIIVLGVILFVALSFWGGNNMGVLADEDINFETSGAYLIFSWNPVDGADGYDVAINGQTVGSVEDTWYKYSGWEDDSKYSYAITPYKSGLFGKKLGNSAIGAIFTEKIDYSILQFNEAMCFDVNRLLKWADTKGIEFGSANETEDGIIIVDLILSDKHNTGFKNGLNRLVYGVVDGVLDSFLGTTDDVLEDFSDFDSAFSALLEADGVKSYMSNKKEEYKSSATAGAIVGGLNAALADTNIHFTYYYTDENDKAFACVMKEVKINNEYYFEKNFSNLPKLDDGSYYISTHNQKVYVYEKTVANCPYWFVLVGRVE